MKVGSVGSQLYLINAQQRDCTNQPSRQRSLSWLDQVARVARMVTIPWLIGIAPLAPVEYEARVDELQTCIRIGAYSVDSIALARCILRNETHFVCIHQE
ncbi:hypothetical protein [Dictyobacter formicarum]|uniref:Uncharacterized protein n=1 Tax=Dictyobacter formicarum TaxID=2778368 RepID=A0ABQ3VNI7_9CHLR|nr:hypothetical protein [Dictyobacter formicarum]GHO87809.1 hypothetical protein KSZ_58150 [Dictyobacter formicarum]